MDCTKIFVEATGFRPTASEAFIPIKPTAIAAPKAARPTWKLPFICSSCSFPPAPAIEHGQAVDINPLTVRRHWCVCFVLAHQHREDSSQEHEDHGLNEAHNQFQEIERNRHQPPEAGNELRHCFQEILSRENVAVETEAKRNWPKQDRNNLKTAGREEHHD